MTTIQPLPVQLRACLPRNRQSIAMLWVARYLPLLLTAAGVLPALFEAGAASEGATLAPIGEPGRAIGLGRGDLALNGSPPEGVWFSAIPAGRAIKVGRGNLILV